MDSKINLIIKYHEDKERIVMGLINSGYIVSAKFIERNLARQIDSHWLITIYE
jgi:hypothetical protein